MHVVYLVCQKVNYWSNIFSEKVLKFFESLIFFIVSQSIEALLQNVDVDILLEAESTDCHEPQVLSPFDCDTEDPEHSPQTLVSLESLGLSRQSPCLEHH